MFPSVDVQLRHGRSGERNQFSVSLFNRRRRSPGRRFQIVGDREGRKQGDKLTLWASESFSCLMCSIKWWTYNTRWLTHEECSWRNEDRMLTTSRKCGVPGEGLPARDENLLLIFDILDLRSSFGLLVECRYRYLLSQAYREGGRERER